MLINIIVFNNDILGLFCVCTVGKAPRSLIGKSILYMSHNYM